MAAPVPRRPAVPLRASPSVRLLPVLLAAGCAAAPPPPLPLQAAPLVGLREVAATDPLSGQPLPAVVFHPAEGASAASTLVGGLYAVEAAWGLPAAPGRRPLIVLSHGHGGSMWGHHHLAAALARAGNLVLVLEHVGDSYRDQRAFESGRALLGRPRQVSAALDAVLADPVAGPLADPARIGVAGFSAGGWTALVLAGARPDLSRFAGYCRRHPGDGEICAPRVNPGVARPEPPRDRRVRAAFAMAPFAVPLSPESFREVTAPLALAWGSADRVLLPEENAEAILPGLATLRLRRRVEGAGHWVFLAPCTSALASRVGELCADPPGIDRAAVHRQVAADAVAFFAEALR